MTYEETSEFPLGDGLLLVPQMDVEAEVKNFVLTNTATYEEPEFDSWGQPTMSVTTLPGVKYVADARFEGLALSTAQFDFYTDALAATLLLENPKYEMLEFKIKTAEWSAPHTETTKKTITTLVTYVVFTLEPTNGVFFYLQHATGPAGHGLTYVN